MSRIVRIAGWLLFFATLGGCSGVDQHDTRIQYRKSTTASPLELPPDLMATTVIRNQFIIPETATYSDYQTEKRHESGAVVTHGVLPQADNVQLQRDGKTRWLVIQNAAPAVVWPQVKSFLLTQGFELSLENPQIGIMETDWAENRADIPQDGLRWLLSGTLDFLYSAPTRDKYRIRLERGKTPDTTELYLTHRGLKEVSHDEDAFVWQDRPADPELEAEMLNRLMVHLGVKPKQATTETSQAETVDTQKTVPATAELNRTTEGDISLLVYGSYDQVWRHIGLALDRIGLRVEDRDQEKGIYYVRYLNLEKGKDSWFSDDKQHPDQEYQIHLKQHQETTQIAIMDKAEKIDTSKSAEEILTLLQEQLQQLAASNQ